MSKTNLTKNLVIENISKNFGGIQAIKEFNLEIQSNELMGIIGPNGAGKTALLNIITGFYRANSGRLFFNQIDITNASIHQISRLGIGRTFQNIRLFKRMSVLENVLVARKQFFASPFLSLLTRGFQKEIVDRSMECLKIMKLADKSNSYAASLSYGDARRLEIARALAGDPKLLLLDEPAAGMNEAETNELIVDIETLRSKVPSIILIEHDMNLIRTLSDTVVAMDFGQKICQGTSQEVLSHPDVMSAYLGDDTL
jgi:branched-chain amino acid transport system ATP-binding protein